MKVTCTFCATDNCELLLIGACSHPVHIKCFEKLKQVKTRKICHMCMKPLSKTATVIIDQSQQMKIVSEKNTIQHQLNIVLNEKAAVIMENNCYKLIIDSMNITSKTMIETQMVNSLTTYNTKEDRS